MSRIKILYIDDEVHNLNAFRASFRRDYAVYTASEIHEARMILDKHTVPIIIADQRMPGTTGIEFFHSINEHYPDSIRILITAYSEAEELVDAINKGQIYRYIKKPWEYYDLQNTIFNAYEIYKTRMELKNKIRGLGKQREERNQFIDRISTDVQGLILSSIGVVNLMKSEDGEDKNEYLEILEENLSRMKNFTQGMLGYYKNTDFFLKNNEIDFTALVHDYIDKYKYLKNITLKVEVNQPQAFYGDLFRIKTVLNHLLDNSIRFQSPNRSETSIVIRVEVDKKEAVLQVKDNGIGIKEKYIDEICNLFFCPKDVEGCGFGIGLYIVREAVHRMHGEIFITSVFGEGTQVEIKLPNQKGYGAS